MPVATKAPRPDSKKIDSKKTINKQTITQADLEHCQRLLAQGSKSFFLAGRLLPRTALDSATALYAFCRVADDLMDNAVGDDAARRALQSLILRLDAVYAGRPLDHPEDRALTALVEHCQLPRAPLDALLEGFAWDATAREYETLDELEAYAARVAGSVGVMMAWLLGERRPQPLARALDLGVAMQLTNICRDVGEDVGLGRLYLPRAMLQAQGLAPEAFLREAVAGPAVSSVVLTLLDRADQLYRRAEQGIQCLPLSVRFSIRAAAALYREIGVVVRARGGDSVSDRAFVRRPRQLRLLAAAVWPRPLDPELLAEPVLPACEYLLSDALKAQTDRLSPPLHGMARMLDLLLKVEHRERYAEQQLAERDLPATD